MNYEMFDITNRIVAKVTVVALHYAQPSQVGWDDGVTKTQSVYSHNKVPTGHFQFIIPWCYSTMIGRIGK
ncbi:unnamed protein product [Pieris brassicae]|uniref:Uncharacterized protein n=1 Tax=Pieris brassicae TaxID=7116 RepID=A0A9P0XB08_PIEBR|nr:unnamed protein product [Pieris brassicae]